VFGTSYQQVRKPSGFAFQTLANGVGALTAAQVRSLMRSTMDNVDKKLEAMAARVRKHLGHGPLFSMVWGTLKSSLLAR
jgi:hypothetical protein